eukprot:g9352.t1
MPLVECAAPAQVSGKASWRGGGRESTRQDSSLHRVWNGRRWVHTRVSTVQNLENRARDKQRVEQELGLPEFADVGTIVGGLNKEPICLWFADRVTGGCEERFLPAPVRQAMDEAEEKRRSTTPRAETPPSGKQLPATPEADGEERDAALSLETAEDATGDLVEEEVEGRQQSVSPCGASSGAASTAASTPANLFQRQRPTLQPPPKAPLLIARGYERIVYGDHGPYVELAAKHINFEAFPYFFEKPHYSYYDEYYAENKAMLYAQKKFVTNKKAPPKTGAWATDNNRPEGYANYVPGMFYLSASAGVLFATRGERSDGERLGSDGGNGAVPSFQTSALPTRAPVPGMNPAAEAFVPNPAAAEFVPGAPAFGAWNMIPNAAAVGVAEFGPEASLWAAPKPQTQQPAGAPKAASNRLNIAAISHRSLKIAAVEQA